MVLVFAETNKGEFKKAALEAVTYGHKTAQTIGASCIAVTIGEIKDADVLGQYGATQVYNINGAGLDVFDSQVYATILGNAVEKLGAKVVVMSHSSTGKSILGRLAARLGAGSVSGVNAIPTNSDGFKVKKLIFSGKAIAEYQIDSAIKLLSVSGNAIQPEVVGDSVSVNALDVEIPASRIKIKSTDKVEGVVPLPEAELVVSAGRGMKGPENWGIIEELADILGATTACSRPVADTHWRPHHEHVGQTGVAISPNLYIAVGISGAIQHLAGVNRSKVIVVINKDPEAPFFKAADYGVVGDLFDVVPKLTSEIKKLKGA